MKAICFHSSSTINFQIPWLSIYCFCLFVFLANSPYNLLLKIFVLSDMNFSREGPSPRDPLDPPEILWILQRSSSKTVLLVFFVVRSGHVVFGHLRTFGHQESAAAIPEMCHIHWSPPAIFHYTLHYTILDLISYQCTVGSPNRELRP